jgi:hypothetical protein
MADKIGLPKVKAEIQKLQKELGPCYSVPKMLG